MDPEATLARAERAYEEADVAECAAALHDYAEWRADGGFAPERGDERFEALFALVADLGLLHSASPR